MGRGNVKSTPSVESLPFGPEYRPVVGCDGYVVGDDGSVWSSKYSGHSHRWRKLIGTPDKDGYLKISMRTDAGGIRHARINTLVLEVFIGPPTEGMVSCHDPNPDRKDNRLSNLRWGTQRSNIYDKIKHGTMAVGERHGMSSLTAEKVIEIRRLRSSGVPLQKIADAVGSTKAAVCGVVYGVTWKHVA